jgi:hypothetical protein
MRSKRTRRSNCHSVWIVGVLTIAALVAMPPAPSSASVAVVSHPTSPAFAPSWVRDALDQDAPDPDVVRFGSTYYAYTTGTVWGNHIGILRSTSPGKGFNTINGLPYGSSAFPSIPAGTTVRPWQVNSTQNAPGVFKIAGRYVMYYTAQAASGHGGHYCLSVATASSPSGPFADHTNAPVLCMDAQGGAVDPSPFIDRAGRPWLYFKTYDVVERSALPSQIFAVRLNASGIGTSGVPTSVLNQSQLPSPYETVENPQMVNVGGVYVLLFSRGVWNSSGYRLGYASCASPIGPCTEQSDALLTSYGNVLGPGGGTIVSTPSGQRVLAYAGWNGAPGCTNYRGTSCARKLYVASLQLSGVQPRAACKPAAPIRGYRLVASDGGIFSFGNQQFCGSTGNLTLNRPIIGMATTKNGGGYWLLASDGGLFAFGNATFHGSTGGSNPPQTIVGMASTPSGNGYWLVARDGNVFAFGDAKSHGTAVGLVSQPVVGMARTQSGHGYWLVTSSGTVLNFGDAHAYGSVSGRLTQPILAIAASPSGRGYWLLGSDGGIFTFGDAHFYGSTGGIHLNQPIVGLRATANGKGYWLVARDGGIFAFGNARFDGSTGAIHLNQPIVGMA